ncbi:MULTISPECIES: hypothetical protein [unclassified Pseudomonas]|uniref:hypothetical protein n=1 Tax=unclassified Pseudomonas TaxID=196821 RepID=UPI000876F0A0|nr:MULTISPECIES: hypothetical protein [unclassified Pseudomonas]SCZ74171.1 hypothetical protein SAMN03159460_04545 [Pseudomonas sp. NFPP17]SDA81387.1 hypothetical protein SAMN03159464_04726 [Pseudomonas sp. NFPP15]SEL78750.1 hypothetical protein SAMN03159324_05226 [Pseudomonas sp. NFPP18]SFA66744.1 hypothetical protein SAMN03159320_05044 [Pseudomonas sp. NFPP13]SFU07741.1 hypothetical protein SAMN03159492_05386 [Pseudomonas sp. NFPP25]
MTTSPVKSLTEEQLEDITAHNLRDAYSLAERRGFFGPPVEQFAEPGYRGRVLQVLRYRVAQLEQRQ